MIVDEKHELVSTTLLSLKGSLLLDVICIFFSFFLYYIIGEDLYSEDFRCSLSFVLRLN